MLPKVDWRNSDIIVLFKEDMVYYIKRNPELSSCSAYVILPPDHPLYEDEYKDYNVYRGVNVNEKIDSNSPLFLDRYTYSKHSEVRFIGFDCINSLEFDLVSHTLDEIENMEDHGGWDFLFIKYLLDQRKQSIFSFYSASWGYPTMKFVIDQLDKLAVQIKERAKKMNREKALLTIKFHAW